MSVHNSFTKLTLNYFNPNNFFSENKMQLVWIFGRFKPINFLDSLI